MMTPKNLFNAAASGTQYSSYVKVNAEELVGFQIDHPASTTTAYTVQASNSTDAAVTAGTDKWFDHTDITIPSKSSAENFGVRVVDFPFYMARIKMVTSSGTGTIRVDATAKEGD